MRYPVTPDGRYFVVRGRLWRCSDPGLSADRRDELTRALMDARRDKGRAMRADDGEGREWARQRVDAAKQALGERGPVWWTDGAPDWNQHMALPRHFPKWLNIYDKRDFLSYLAAPIFPDHASDEEVDNGQPFPQSHGAYWLNNAVWKAIGETLK